MPEDYRVSLNRLAIQIHSAGVSSKSSGESICEVMEEENLDLQDVAEITGFPARMFVDAVRTETIPRFPSGHDQELSDRELAAQIRSYGYAEENGAEELHLRYPELAGVAMAYKSLLDSHYKDIAEKHPDLDLDIDPHPPTASKPNHLLLIQNKYRELVDRIADNGTL